MQINWKKKKVLTVKQGGGTSNTAVKGETTEEVNTMKCLGALFNGDEEIAKQNWGWVEGDWSNDIRSPGEKRTEQGYEVEGNGGAYVTIMGVTPGQYRKNRRAGHRRQR